jgi:glutamate racemase
MKIGVFDSGIGGITVLNALKARFSNHEFLYFGDTANVPYGTKSEHQIQALVTSAALRMKEKDIDALVIACNTASSIAYEHFKSVLDPIPLIDVVEAGVASVLDALLDPMGPVLIFGTRATVKSKIYSRLLHEKNSILKVYEQECPLLVPMIEEGWLDHPALELTAKEYVAPYLHLRPGVALLACTHYPWIKKTFEALLPDWTILDSAHAVADITEKSLNLSEDRNQIARIIWHFSDPDAVASNKMFDAHPLKF